jgi:hypothetical protein
VATLVPDTAPQHLTGTGAPQPTAVVDGLAVHVVGDGPPLLLRPNPQGMVGGCEEEPALFLRTISAFLGRDGAPAPADAPTPAQAASALRATTTSTVSASNA